MYGDYDVDSLNMKNKSIVKELSMKNMIDLYINDKTNSLFNGVQKKQFEEILKYYISTSLNNMCKDIPEKFKSSDGYSRK